MTACIACPLHETRRRIVHGEGPENATLVILGEMPDRTSDRQGKPFCGRPGELLDEMLAEVGWSRARTLLSHVVLCSAGRNRTPYPEEVAACAPRTAELAAHPRAVVVVTGRAGIRLMLDSEQAISRLRGRVYWQPRVESRLGPRPVVVTYAPDFMLKKPLMREKVIEDLALAVRSARLCN